jgi:glycosyltransferase involved in cell wall biosynthesis
MRMLFIHRTMPGQFGRLAASFAADGHEVIFLARTIEQAINGVRAIVYPPARKANNDTHRYLVACEDAILAGQAAARECLRLKHAGFRPDLIVAHPGWGESLFVKEVFPAARLANYCEFFHGRHGGDVGFDPAEPVTLDDLCRVRTRNAHLLLALTDCDRGFSPTHWQKQIHPPEFQSKIDVVFDGVDAEQARPAAGARFSLPDGRVLVATDEVVTYVARHLEPYRGFPTMMRAIPEILARRPAAQIVIAGSDGVAYGRAAADGRSWREQMLDEVGFDRGRVHFVGTLAYNAYLSLLQVSSAHVYLTVPFVLSWSVMEAMAAGCIVIGSATPPVAEVIEDGRNGFLVDFFSHHDLARRVIAALKSGADLRPMRQAARQTILDRYEAGACLRQQKVILSDIGGARLFGA